MRRNPHWIGKHDPRVAKDLLELTGCFGIAVRRKISLPAYIWRIEASKRAEPTAREGYIVGLGPLQKLDRLRGVAAVQRHDRAYNREVSESDAGILRESLIQVVHQNSRLYEVARGGERKSSAILNIAVLREFERGLCSCFRVGCIAEQSFPHRRTGFKHSGPFGLMGLRRQIPCPSCHGPGLLQVTLIGQNKCLY